MNGGRQKMIALIHVAKRELALCDENYRALLSGATGKDSLKDMSLNELQSVIKRFEKFGFTKKNTSKRAGAKKTLDNAQHRMMRALWISLYNLGEVRDPSDAALASYICRMTKLTDASWISSHQANKIISGLKEWAGRSGVHEGENNIDWARNVVFAQIVKAFACDEERARWMGRIGINHLSEIFPMQAGALYALSEDLGIIIRGKNVRS